MKDVDKVVGEVERGFRTLANAIMPLDVAGGNDATGGRVESLTEAVMGMTSALVEIARSITDLAEAVREREV